MAWPIRGCHPARMTSSFVFEAITPSAEWQHQSLSEFHAASTAAARDAALTEIVAAFAAYVGVIARSWWRRFGRLHGNDGLQDIESAGRHALLIAVQRWRPCFEKPFVHFAGKWVSESCKTEVARLQEGTVPVPLRVRLLCREYRSLDPDGSSRDEFLHRHRLRDSTKKAVRFLAQAGPRQYVSVDVGETEDMPPFQLPSNSRPIPATAELLEQLEAIRQVLLTRCTSRQRLIFHCVFPELRLTVREIGDVHRKDGMPIDPASIRTGKGKTTFATMAALLGITRERVRQLQNETMLKIRAVLNGRDLLPTAKFVSAASASLGVLLSPGLSLWTF